MRKAIAIDFDGTIYPTPFVAPGVCDGPASPDALEFIKTALDAGWRIIIHSTRLYDQAAAPAIRDWLHDQCMQKWNITVAQWIVARIEFQLTKPWAAIYIDDKGFHYRGRFPRLADIA